METQTRGMATSAIIAIIAVILVIGGAVYYNARPEGEIMMNKGEEMMKEGESMMEEGENMMDDGESMMKEGESMMEENGDSMMMHDEYQGERLAGTREVPLLDFKKADYDKAISEGKLVVLYFYANWCPVCRAEFPKMEAAFNQLPAISSVKVENVVGFRVNYNDNETDSDEKQLARDFGVAYQHTKVFVKNGERILKSPEGWDEDRYISEITNAIK